MVLCEVCEESELEGRGAEQTAVLDPRHRSLNLSR